MRKSDDGKPLVDATGQGFGVRGTPVNGAADVDIDQCGNVILNGKGMSVAPTWRDLPYFLISRRLKQLFPAARGSIELFCFTMGEGRFEDGPVASGLELKADSPSHGVVVPRTSVPLDRYQMDLANTRGNWIVDEA
jgi:hypothetical protein